MSLKFAIVIALAALGFAAAPTQVFAGVAQGWSNDKAPNSFHCKSGKVVHYKKACKENGGKF